VASFFAPTSQKAQKSEIVWQVRENTLLVGKFAPLEEESSSTEAGVKRNKIAAFDFDSTLISTASGKKFATDAQDWKWWHASVVDRLQKLYQKEGQERSRLRPL